MGITVDPVLQSAKALVGISGAEFGYLLLKSSATAHLNESLTGLPEAAGPVRLLDASGELVNTFATANVAALMTIFQTISPLTRSLAAVEKLQRLTSADIGRSEYQFRRHRLRTLPTIAALHSLPYVGSTEIRAIDDVVERAVREALDEKPNHESLEIIWQSALAALIRNNFNWETISFSEATVSYASSTCIRYLDGEALLFYSALAAYQFLLSYEQALSARFQEQSSREMRAVRQGFANIKQHGRYHEDYWFRRMSRLYHDRRSLQEMLPQQSEIILALPKYAKESNDVARFFFLSRLHGHQILNDVWNSRIRSRYFSESALANPAVSLAFQFNRAASSQLLSEIKKKSNLKDAVRDLRDYADQKLDKLPNVDVPGIADVDDLNIASMTVPFREFDEIGAFEQTPSLNIRQLLEQMPTNRSSAIAFLCENTLPIAHEYLRKFGGAYNEVGIRTAAIRALENDPSAVTKLEGAAAQLLDLKKARFVSQPSKVKDKSQPVRFTPSDELVRYWSRAMRLYTNQYRSPLAKRGIDLLSKQSEESIKEAFTDRLLGLFGLLGHRQKHGLEDYNPLESDERFSISLQHEILDNFVIALDEFGAFTSLLREELRTHLRNGKIAGDWGELSLNDGALVLRTGKLKTREPRKLSPLKILKG